MSDVDLSVVIMHHPRRSDQLEQLLRACRPLPVRVVEDPDPSGPASALRAAKAAWAAIADGATHHLVLQDDIRPVDDFAQHVMTALRHQPDVGVSLYTNWDSPLNSHVVRRTALAGLPWAPLSPTEWIPTLALALPVEHARALAAWLAGLSDDSHWGDDDEAVLDFCNQRGIRVLCTVPHLLDHTDLPSLSGNDLDGSRHATVLVPSRVLPPDHWAAASETAAAHALWEDSDHPAEYVVELRRSRCSIRFVRPAVGEYLSHPFGWYWHDWCEIVGIDSERILDELDKFLVDAGCASPIAALDLPTCTEVWAAGYLFGGMQSRGPFDPTQGSYSAPLRGALRDGALGSWIDSGLAPSPIGRTRQAFIDVCMAGVLYGAANCGARR